MISILKRSMTTFANTKKRGAFIVFEGIDRCGKSTQSELLGKSLANAENVRFPDRTSCIGTLINSYLSSASDMSDQTIHLLFSANRWEALAGIKSKLESGTTLVCDRYAHSGVVFSSAKGMDMEWCMNCDRGLIAPDAIIYLDMPVEDATKRGDFGLERYEKREFQEKVRECFTKIREKEANDTSDKHKIPWHIIDARQSKEDLAVAIKDLVENIVQETADKPLQKLWS